MRWLLLVALLAALGALAWLRWGAEVAPAHINRLVAKAESDYDRNDHDAAAALYAEAAALALEAGDEARATALAAQSGVCLKLAGRVDEAREALLPALQVARRLKDQRTEGLALGNLARVEGLAGNDELALDYLLQLVALADRIDDARLGVQTLEQAAMLSLTDGHPSQALELLERALTANVANQGQDDRRDALLRERATIQVALGDDEGALASWGEAAPAPAAMANQALLLARLGLHQDAAELALHAALQLESEGPERRRERDQALMLSFSEDLSAGRLDACRQGLEPVLASGADKAALAPFQALDGRLALREGRNEEAARMLREAADQIDDPERADSLRCLAAVALGQAGQLAEADDLLASLTPSLARCLVLGWLHREQPPASGLALDLMPELSAEVSPEGDHSVSLLRLNCPLSLPSMAWLALHHHLADADRLRDAGQPELARQSLRRGVVAALRWQWLEARQLLLEDWPEGGLPADREAWIQAHARGELPADEALLVVLPSASLSYLVLCTSSLGATSFGLPGEAELGALVDGVSTSLHGTDGAALTAASARLFTALIGDRARVDLARRSRWSLLLPDLLAAVPPALWVESESLPGEPVHWLVSDHVLRFLPCAPAAVGPPDATRRGWARAGEPALDPARSALVLPALLRRYGEGILSPGGLRPVAPDEPEGPTLTGAELTLAGLTRVAASAAVLEASVPGLGGGRLGGLLLAPDPEASRGDARAGVLPWHQLAKLPLPPLVILDRTRFDPGDRRHGPALAAAAVLCAGAQWTLLSRWPLPQAARQHLLASFSRALERGSDPASALGLAQRAWLDAAARAGRHDLEHPRYWAALMAWGGP